MFEALKGGTDRETERQTDRQTDSQTARQTDYAPSTPDWSSVRGTAVCIVRLVGWGDR